MSGSAHGPENTAKGEKPDESAEKNNVKPQAAQTGNSAHEQSDRPNIMAEAMLRHEQASNRIHNKTGALRRQ